MRELDLWIVRDIFFANYTDLEDGRDKIGAVITEVESAGGRRCIYLAISAGGAYRSDDDGASWSEPRFLHSDTTPTEHGWDVEERAARVVTTALDVISWCATEPAGTPPSFRIYTNTRRRVLRSAVRARSEPVVFVDDYSSLEACHDTPERNPEAQHIDELVEWVRQRARVRDDAARLVVMTRVAGVSVDEVAAIQEVDPQTLRQRRLRTERRVRQNLVLSR